MSDSFRAVVCIGNPRGRVALFLDEDDCRNLAEQFPPPDVAHAELLDAMREAYPPRGDDE